MTTHILGTWLVAAGLGGVATIQYLPMSKGHPYSRIYNDHKYLLLAGWLVIVASLVSAIAVLLVRNIGAYGGYFVFGCTLACLLVKVDTTVRFLAHARRNKPQPAAP